MRLLRPIARCQCRPLSEQGDGTCEMVDVRVRLHHGEVWVSHGAVRYVPFAQAERLIVEHARRLGRDVTVRVLLEGEWPVAALMLFEQHVGAQRGMRYVCGRHRKGWRKMLDLPDMEVDQSGVASMCRTWWGWWGALWPWLWCRTVGRSRLSEGRSEGDIPQLYDFL